MRKIYHFIPKPNPGLYSNIYVHNIYTNAVLGPFSNIYVQNIYTYAVLGPFSNIYVQNSYTYAVLGTFSIENRVLTRQSYIKRSGEK